MKKISLKSVKEFLSRDEMRVVSGGSGGYCGASCYSSQNCVAYGESTCLNCYNFPNQNPGPGFCL